jgi:hypothetical protein
MKRARGEDSYRVQGKMSFYRFGKDYTGWDHKEIISLPCNTRRAAPPASGKTWWRAEDFLHYMTRDLHCLQHYPQDTFGIVVDATLTESVVQVLTEDADSTVDTL